MPSTHRFCSNIDYISSVLYNQFCTAEQIDQPVDHVAQNCNKCDKLFLIESVILHTFLCFGPLSQHLCNAKLHSEAL